MKAMKIINVRLGSDSHLTELQVENGYFVEALSADAGPWAAVGLSRGCFSVPRT